MASLSAFDLATVDLVQRVRFQHGSFELDIYEMLQKTLRFAATVFAYSGVIPLAPRARTPHLPVARLDASDLNFEGCVFDTDWLINRVANIPHNALAVALMTVFHVFDDEPSAVRSIAWGLRA